MTKVGITCAIVVVLIGGLTSLGRAEETVSGEWHGNYIGAGGERLEFYLKLQQDGEKVTGTYSNPGAGARGRPIDRAVDGTFKDGVLVWGSLQGKVTGDSMAGMMRAQAGPILNFTATRTKK